MKNRLKLWIATGLALVAFPEIGFSEEEDYESIVARYEPIAELAARDVSGAVEALRTTPNLHPEHFYLIFKDLSFTDHFNLLQRVVDDETLANRFVFDFFSLNPAGLDNRPPELGTQATGDNLSVLKAMIQLRNDAAVKTVNSVPKGVSAPLVIPALWSELSAYNVAIGIIALALSEADLGVNSEESARTFIAELNREILKDQVPEAYHEIIELVKRYTGIVNDSDYQKNRSAVVSRIAGIVAAADLPLAVRLGFASMGSRDDAPLPDAVALLVASWLAEAWERGIPVGADRAPALLRHFVSAYSHPQWKSVAARLVAAWPGHEQSNADAFPFVVGIAAMSGDRRMVADLLRTQTEPAPSLSSDPMLPLLIKAGFYDTALNQLASRKSDLLPGWSTGPERASGVFYDQQLESRLPSFLEKVGSSEVRFIVELFLKNLMDDPRKSPQSKRADRVIAMAHKLKTITFNAPPAKLAALNIIGDHPEAAAEIADVYVNYAQFDQVERHLSDVMRGQQWIDLCDDTFKAVVHAERFGEAAKIVEKVEAATVRSMGVSFSDHYHQTWEAIARTIDESLAKSETVSEQFLQVALRVSSQPEDYFSASSCQVRGKLIEKTIARYADSGGISKWWAAFHQLPKARQLALAKGLVEHILRYSELDEIPGSKSFEGLSAAKQEVMNHLKLVEEFARTPHGASTTQRLDVLLQGTNADTFAAIALAYQFRFLSADELIEHADRLVAALPAANLRKWSDLATVARAAGKIELANLYSKRSRDSNTAVR